MLARCLSGTGFLSFADDGLTPIRFQGNEFMRGRIITLYAMLAAGNIVAWAWAFWVFKGDAVLLGTAFLAYTFGLRHAVDADHIAAIDNATRKLMQQGQRPVGVGFFFSLGHSLVVVLASAAVAVAAHLLQNRFSGLREVGRLISSLVSVSFLFAMAAANLFVLGAIWRSFQKVKRGVALAEEDFETFLTQRGFLARLLRPHHHRRFRGELGDLDRGLSLEAL